MRLIAMLLSAAICLNAQAPQPRPPQFKTGIEIRLLDIVVLDADGQPVRSLTAADFVIVEDGQPQTISTLEEIVVPEPTIPLADWMRDVSADVGTNDIPTDGRLIIVVLDDAMNRDPTETERAKRIAREIVEQLGPSDLASIVFTLENQKSQDFTADRPRLLAAIERMRPGPGNDGAIANELGPKYSMRTVKKAAEYLRSIEGRRKTLIYVSVGVPIDWNDIANPVANLGAEGVTVGDKEAMRSLGDDLQDTLGESQLSNVAVYAVSPRGLTVEDQRLETDFLETISANTGGFAIVNTNAPETRVPEIFTATSSYYLIGYEVQKPDDGRYRRLEVKVNRPGVTVQARKGYTAPRRDRRASNAKPDREISPLATAMAGFLPKGDVPMRATAIPFAVPGKSEAGVAIVARVQQPPATKRVTQQVELLTTAFDPHGKARGSRRQTATVAMLPSDGTTAEYEVLSRIDLKPGRYSLRIAAHNPAIDKSGSVFLDLDVPEFRRNGLWMSGVALTSRYGVAAAPPGALDELLPVVPTTAREFAEDDVVQGFFQVTQGGRRAPVAARLDITIVDSADAVVHRASDTLDASMFSASRMAEYQFPVPLEHLRAGHYLLRIEIIAARLTARREIRFSRK